MKLNRQKGGRGKLLSEHVVYEIDMMRATFNRLESPIDDSVSANAHIESFCVHARNLIDFFCGTGPISGDEAAARHFSDDSYKPFPGGHPRHTKLYGKLNAQIAHLSYGRTSSDDQKIQRSDRVELMKLIEAEILNFSSHIVEELRIAWPARITIQGVSPRTISVTATTLTSSSSVTTSFSLPPLNTGYNAKEKR